MPEFSPELYKKHQDGSGFDATALATLDKLRRKVLLPGELFKEQETGEFERFKMLFPDEWELLQNQDAFNELDPRQRQQVINDYINKRMGNVAGLN